MLVDAVRWYKYPAARSIIFRRTYPELEELINRSRELYPILGGRFREQSKTWVFPSGMRLKFRYCERDKDIFRYQGHAYDFIGFDESTHFNEGPIRFMVSRLRSKDPFLQKHLRMRLATNPGNVGHRWHKHVFMGERCPHCAPKGARGVRQAWHVYSDAKWFTDSRPVKLTTQFIPGRLADHTLLGPEYINQLESLPATLAKAMKEGCWDLFVGQYFDCWDKNRMVVPRKTLDVKDWWAFWVGLDYGFSGSSAVAHLFAKNPEGVIYIIDELVRERMQAADFAVLIRDRWHTPYPNRQTSLHYLSPDCWNNIGDGHQRSDQMTEASGLTFDKASTDRCGGAMLLYTYLDKNQLKIADNCELLIAAIPAMVHDEDGDPNDVAKVKNDPYDDAYDSARYGLYSYIGDPKVPREVQLNQAVANINDPTQAMIAYRMAEQKLNKGIEPISYRTSSSPWRFGRS